jgi:protein-S-isoprenylcysteine O-methyltransferase Ste14
MSTIFTAARALFFASGFVLLWGWLALYVSRMDARAGRSLPAWCTPLGWAVGVPALALELICIGAFVVRGQGTPAPFDAPRRVVAVGPYKYVRNPMYLGGLALLAAFGLYLRSPAVVVFAFLWALAVHLGVVYLEEPDLRRRFGASYDEYCRAVPRWIPRFSTRRRQAETHSAEPR